MDFRKSRCKTGYLHKFMTMQATQNGVLERCIKPFCGVKHVIKLVKGEPSPVDYARFHMREFLIPQHREFNREFRRIPV